MKKYTAVATAVLLGMLIVAGCVPSGVRLFEGDTPSLTFTPTVAPDGQVGAPYSLTIKAVGGPVRTMSCTAPVAGDRIPVGLAVSRDETGNSITISGTPTEPGVFSFRVFADCYGTQRQGASGEQLYCVRIAPLAGTE